MVTIEEPVLFAESRIWAMQAAYYCNTGNKAWSNDEVPRYIANNPVIGRAYAELAFAFLADLAARGRQETVYLIEPGAGHGSLCYYFFKQYEKLLAYAGSAMPAICYIITDFSEQNISFCREHPRLQPYRELGWLDFAYFDACSTNTLSLLDSGSVLSAGSLEQPVIVLANYFFDSIPSTLLYFNKQQVFPCLLSLHTDADTENNIAAEDIQLQYSLGKAGSRFFEEDYLQDIVEFYCRELNDAYVLIPDVALRCIDQLGSLSRQGLFLITSDKGYHRLESLNQPAPPDAVNHGSFSLPVNYHAFKLAASYRQGLSVFPRSVEFNLLTGCILLLHDAQSYTSTRLAAERLINENSPDDFYSMKELVTAHAGLMNIRHIITAVRAGNYDAWLLCQLLPRLHQVLDSCTEPERWALFQAVHQVWDNYYPLSSGLNVSFELGYLLLRLSFYREALAYFNLSDRLFGVSAAGRYNMALCYMGMLEWNRSLQLTEELLEAYPGNAQALKLHAMLHEIMEKNPPGLGT